MGSHDGGYSLVEVTPQGWTELLDGDSYYQLEAERDRLNAEALVKGLSLRELRYAVWARGYDPEAVLA